MSLFGFRGGSATIVPDRAEMNSRTGVGPSATANLLPSFTAYALSNNTLIPFSLNTPTTPGLSIPVTGLGTGETLAGIDFRPQNGHLYGLSTNGTGGVRLYEISHRTGIATPLSAAPVQFDDGTLPVPIPGTAFGVDFNPTVDRFRVVTSGGFNFRMNPNTGALVDGNAATAGINPDGAINTGATSADATAYTNNVPNATVTTQYTLDAVSNTLFIQNPPNNGTLTMPLPVTLGGVPLDFDAPNGFDIPVGVNVSASNTPAVGTGFALLTVSGVTGLYAIDLSTGSATLCGLVGTGALQVQGFAVQSEALAGGIPAIALRGNGTSLSRLNTANPATITSVAVTGISLNETLVGIDYRPATGQLMGLAVNEVTDQGSVYILDPQTGAATLVGTAGAVSYVNGSATRIDLPPASAGYGFDFNPTVDRIRVTTANGFNFRINPATGAPVDGDLGLAAGTVPGINPDGNAVPSSTVFGAGAGVTGTAYTNSFSGTTVTTQYTLDATSNSLFIQNPPNSGTQTQQIVLQNNGNVVNFNEVSGFDIPASTRVSASNTPVTSGQGFAALNLFEGNFLYSINLVNGAATQLGTIGDGTGPITGLALGEAAGRPSITPIPISFPQGSLNLVRTVATVSDAETAAGNLTVAVTGLPAGVTFTSLVNSNGTISAAFTSTCSTLVGSSNVTLTVTDAEGQTASAQLPLTITANTAPMVTYPATQVVLGAVTTITPTTATDNGSIVNYTGTVSTGFSGTFSINPLNGTISVNPNVEGIFTVTVTALDNCGAASSTSFTLSQIPFGKGPVINTISPLAGPLGSSVTITGFRLTTVTNVTLNGAPMSFKVDSDGQLTATVPPRATTGVIAVSAPSGSFTGPTFTVIRTK